MSDCEITSLDILSFPRISSMVLDFSAGNKITFVTSILRYPVKTDESGNLGTILENSYSR